MCQEKDFLILPSDWPTDIALPPEFGISQYNYLPGGLQLVLLGYMPTQDIIDFFTANLSSWQLFHSKYLETNLQVLDNWALGFNQSNRVLLVTITQTQYNDDGVPTLETILCLQHISSHSSELQPQKGSATLPLVKIPESWPAEVTLPPEAELLTCGMLNANTYQATMQGLQAPAQYLEFFIKAHPNWEILQNICDERDLQGNKHIAIFLQMQYNNLFMQITGGKTLGSDIFTSFMVLVAKNN